MTDHTELKRLAEAAPTGPWIAENDSIYFKDDGYTRHLLDADAGHDVEDEAYYTALRFIAAANPKAVLALIAENKRVKARLCMCRDCAGQGEVYSGTDSYQGHNQPPEPDMDVCGTCGGDGVLGPLEDFEALAAERDQLKAENEALRKDAERYRWTCVEGNWVARMFGKWRAHIGEYGDSSPTEWYATRDEAIDAAMGKEPQP